MRAEQAVRLIEIVQKNTNELFERLVAELNKAQSPEFALSAADIGTTDPTAPVAGDVPSEAWALEDATPTGGWDEIGRSTETYKWPDGNLDRYSEFIKYQGTGGFQGMILALGYLNNGDVVGFALGTGGGSKRGITYFFPADDFARTNEKVSMIRGGGPNGRSGFGPNDATPKAYSDFKLGVLRDRKTGKWNVQAVVADADDHKTMLRHTAIQARLRKLV